MGFRSGLRGVIVSACLMAWASGCGGHKEVGVIDTSKGAIVVELYGKDAPQHVANFKKLAAEGFYKGTTFHRIVPGFVIQGGDPNSKDDNLANDGAGGPGYTLPAEIKLKHERGSLAAARTGDEYNPTRASSGSQFYICLQPLEMLDGQYTVYGKVIEGMEVVDAIARLPRITGDPQLASQPVEKVVIKDVRVEKR